ncbi:SusD/RagB family nutrient-binding outer membrane lipoprotein [Flavihumibacter sp. R14]|nr:SusD/RagB family nutrient-binding outer membrane lipoprotein [Flavihumibacter soli]
MKTIYKKSIPVFLVALLFSTGCTKDFDEINTDPTAASASNFDSNYLLTTCQLTYTGSTDFSYETWRANLIYFSTAIQQMSHVAGYWVGDKYLLNEAYAAAYFERAYAEQVKNVADLIKLTENKPELNNVHQIARIMRALIMERITDIYGDVPYTDAGLGYYTKNYFLKYDKQQDIYTDILKELEEATNALNPAGDIPSGDLFYKGDIQRWQRFGNTLMLRAAMRLTKVDPATAQAYVTKAIGKTMTSNLDNAIVRHEEPGGRETVNRISQVITQSYERPVAKLSKTYVDMMKNNNDPRLGVVAELDNGDKTPANQKGMPNGYDQGGAATDITKAVDYTGLENYSRPSEWLVKMDGPTFILTYAESELLLADAAQRWGIAGSAAEHYNNGVKAGITYFGEYDLSAAAIVTPAAADAYLAAHPYNSANGLEMINNQFWLATLFNGYEAWSNWRRTGYPVLTPVNYPGNVTNATIPRRLPYPLSEANNNGANYQEAAAAVPGGDKLTGRVWWDVQ